MTMPPSNPGPEPGPVLAIAMLQPELFVHKEEPVADEPMGPYDFGPDVTVVVSGGEVWTSDGDDEEGGDDNG
jgi:hypothetical protein